VIRHPVVCGQPLAISGDPADLYFAALADGLPVADPVLDLLPRLVTDNESVVVDVGANLGLHALALARLAAKGRVYAFEPAPQAAAFLAENVEANGAHQVTVCQSGMGAEPGMLELFVNGEFLAGSLTLDAAAPVLRAHLGGAHRDGGQPAIVRVPRTTLDDFAREADLHRLDLVKIDTEGHDLHVLTGGRKVIDQLRPAVLVEFASFALTMHAQTLPADALGAIREMFDRVFVLEPAGRLREIAEPVDAWRLLHENATSRPVQDLLCLFDDHPAVAVAEDLAFRDAPGAPAGTGSVPAHMPGVERQVAVERERADRLSAEIAAIHRTLSWRITRPLRAVRRLTRRAQG
jgi:FkbM family methyltransferase